VTGDLKPYEEGQAPKECATISRSRHELEKHVLRLLVSTTDEDMEEQHGKYRVLRFLASREPSASLALAGLSDP
jgi:hypothetical protein